MAALAALACVLPLAAQQEDPMLRAMREEMERTRPLRLVETPYFIDYLLYDGINVGASATLGALISSSQQHYRLPRVRVRVGDYSFDNTNFVATDFFSGTRYDVERFPVDDSYPVIRQHLWLATDTAYKAAIEAISRKRAALRNVAAADQLPDLWRAEPVVMVKPAQLATTDETAWSGRVRRLSAVFLKYPAVEQSVVDFQSGQSIRYQATSEGTRIRVPEGSAMVRIRAAAQAPDGMPVRDTALFFSPDASNLPPEAELERAAGEVAGNVAALTKAPLGEGYTGPVLFEGAAGAQIMAELLGKNLTVPRRPVMMPGRPMPFPSGELEGRLGARILPEWMDVVDDPTQAEWRGRPLFGHYDVDMEGVVPQPLALVEKGVLKNFLLTRQPVKGFERSNGRARLPGNFGASAASFGNLFVRASETTSAGDLRKKLISLCEQRNKPYGIIIRKMDFPSSASYAELRRLMGATQGGSASRPVSVPLLVYRLYPDGREELVRGLRFRGLTPRAFKDILAASDETFVFDFLDNSAPFALMDAATFASETAVIAPSILVDDLELERPPEEFQKPPVVPPPPLAAESN
jgi:TldD protein